MLDDIVARSALVVGCPRFGDRTFRSWLRSRFATRDNVDVNDTFLLQWMLFFAMLMEKTIVN